MARKVRDLPPDMAAAIAEGERLRAERKARVDVYTEEVRETYIREHGSLAPASPPIPPSTRHVHGDCLRDVERYDSTRVFIRRFVGGREQWVYETAYARLVDGRWVVSGPSGRDTDRWCSVIHTGVER